MVDTKRLLTSACLAASLAIGVPALLGHPAAAQYRDERREMERSQDRIDDQRDAIRHDRMEQRRDLQEGNVSGAMREQREIDARRDAIEHERDRRDYERDRFERGPVYVPAPQPGINVTIPSPFR